MSSSFSENFARLMAASETNAPVDDVPVYALQQRANERLEFYREFLNMDPDAFKTKNEWVQEIADRIAHIRETRGDRMADYALLSLVLR